MHRTLLLVGLSAAIVAVWAPSAASTPPDDVTIQVSRLGNTWSASGTLSDSGTFADDRFLITDSLTVHGFRTFTGSAGTFTARFDARILATNTPGVFSVSGRWAVIAGTGAYERLHGSGTILETFTPGVPPFLTGKWEGSTHSD